MSHSIVMICLVNGSIGYNAPVDHSGALLGKAAGVATGEVVLWEATHQSLSSLTLAAALVV